MEAISRETEDSQFGRSEADGLPDGVVDDIRELT